jgi:hypothetical protein
VDYTMNSGSEPLIVRYDGGAGALANALFIRGGTRHSRRTSRAQWRDFSDDYAHTVEGER